MHVHSCHAVVIIRWGVVLPCRYLISQHAAVETRLAAELDAAGLLASSERLQLRTLQHADLSTLPYLSCVCKVQTPLRSLCMVFTRMATQWETAALQPAARNSISVMCLHCAALLGSVLCFQQAGMVKALARAGQVCLCNLALVRMHLADVSEITQPREVAWLSRQPKFKAGCLTWIITLRWGEKYPGASHICL